MERKPIRQKPHRLPREDYFGEVTVAFTLCVADNETLFKEPSVVETFVTVLRRSTTNYSTQVIIYCFMPDHLHMILRGLTATADLWKTVVDFKQRSGYWFHMNREGFRWQKGFYDHVIRKSEDLGSQLRYIAENPVRKGLVQHWDDYPYTGSFVPGIDSLMDGVSDIESNTEANLRK